MNFQQAENFRTFIRHMETRCNRELNMNVVSDCGAPACAMGELPSVPEFAHLRLSLFRGRDVYLSAGSLLQDGVQTPICNISSALFGLNEWEHIRLFGAGSCNVWLCKIITPHQWALEAHKLLREKGYAQEDFAAFMAKTINAVLVEA